MDTISNDNLSCCRSKEELLKELEKKNEYIDMFLDMYHELKTPLSIILGAINILEKDNIIIDSSKAHKYLKFIKLNCYRLLRLVNHVLDFAKAKLHITELNVTKCNLTSIIRQMTESVIPYADLKKININFETTGEEIVCAIDIDKLERIILNLLSNAIKYSRSNSNIYINAKKDHNDILISIKDDGPGIPRNKQKAIFEKYFSLNTYCRSSSSSGLGLGIAKSLAELHGGKITLKSSQKKGSLFTLTIPFNNSDKYPICIENADNENLKIINSVNIELSDIYNHDNI